MIAWMEIKQGRIWGIYLEEDSLQTKVLGFPLVVLKGRGNTEKAEAREGDN